ncbi:zinc finger protein 91-like [Gigantopelta aegis]|uniref:zinc finger protein 91-like n=1 Tax=Gigantopelta aegis TaxID=1735272 RepID=UPI001B88874B|nr:zinc finger protein 91-like [Gigantopelta aegis]
MDELEGCDVCGGDHITEECPELGLAVSRESPLQTKARLTLPQGLDVVTDGDGNTTVVALQPFAAKTQFGPFEARKTTFSIDADHVFVLKVFTKDGGTVCYDTTDENFCNWLCLVRTAETASDQNLIAYTLGVNIFYNTTRDIPAGQQLRVWYAPAYARKLGKSPTPDGVTTIMLGEMLIFQEDDTLSQIDQIATETINSARGDATQSETYPENTSSATIGGSSSSSGVIVKHEAVFQCMQCGSTFQSQSDYVRHLREHLMPSRDKPTTRSSTYKCKTCQVGFNTYSNYNRHMKKHDGNRIQCPICKHNTYRADLFTTHYVGKHKQTYEEAKRILSEHSFNKTSKQASEDAETTGQEDGQTENVVTPRRKRGRPRRKPIKVELSDDEAVGEVGEVSDAGADDDDDGDDDDDDDKSDEVDSKKAKLLLNYMCVKCGKSFDSYTGLQIHKSEHVIKTEVKMESVSPVRVQPRRSLKGRRITGKLAESDDETPQRESVHVDTTPPAATSPWKKAGRGRPRKNVQAAEGREDDADVSQRTKESMGRSPSVVPESRRGESEFQSPESGQESSEAALEKEVVHVLIGLGEGHAANAGNTELVNETDGSKSEEETPTGTMVKTEQSESVAGDAEQTELPDASCSDAEEHDGRSEDEDFVPEPEPTRMTVVRRRRGRPPGSFRKRPVDWEILDLEKRTRVEETAGGKVYGCGVCGKKFEQQSYLRLHLPRHTSKFKCKYCGRSFARKESFQKHDCRAKNIEIVSHDRDGKKVFTCGECKKSFNTWESARQHTLQHTGSFTCHLCQRVFSRRHLLLDHICHSENGKNKDLFQCEICQQEFRTLRYLYRHMAMHTDIFKCDSCSKTFSRKDSLQRHLLKCNPEMASEQNIFPCTICKKVFSTKLGLENHQINCAKYVCETCRLAFFTEENLDQHKCMGKVLHDDASIHYACTECGKSFASINYLRRHEMNHNSSYMCDICQRSFAQQDQYAVHHKLCWAKQEINNISFVECDICKEHFEDAKEYRDHYQSHTHPHKCNKCGKRFIKIGTLAMHVCSTSRDEDQTVACMQCNKLFKNQKAMEKHQVKHGEPTEECDYCKKKFHKLQDHICHMPDGTIVRVVVKKNRLLIKENLVCHECGRSFVSVSNLNKHILIHGERQNECDICGKKFHYANYLREHKKMVHMKAYRLQCSECGKVLFSKTGLVAHMRQFHDSEIKLFQCPECPKTFRQKGNLKTHMFSHTKVKGFTCEFCRKMFKYPDQYNRHKLEHTMTNKIECALCDKKFCREYQHRKHVELHHSGIVYICDICHERCSHRHTIIRHYKRKHPDVAYLFDENPTYTDSLQKAVNSMDEQPQQAVSVKLETMIATDENGIEREYTIHTDREESYLPQVAARALQNLSNGVIQTEMEDGTTMSTITGPNGEQTVVILQIVNSDGTNIEEATIEEVPTMIEETEVVTEN